MQKLPHSVVTLSMSVDGKIYRVPNEVLFVEVESRIAEGKSVTIPFAGVSMAPILHNREDRVTIAPLSRPPKRGDVILFRYQGRHILHRLKDIQDDSLTMQGDNCITQENITRKDVVGILTTVHRKNGNSIDCASFRWYLHSQYCIIRRLIRTSASKYFNKQIRQKLSPWYFVCLLMLMWLPLGSLGAPLNNFVLGIRVDHLVHASVYIPCTFFLMDKQRLSNRQVWMVSILIAMTTEFVQFILPYRGFDINDLFANFLGVTLGWILIRKHVFHG